MSSYWDALARAAQGLPGAAEPRPRSLFERADGGAALEAPSMITDEPGEPAPGGAGDGAPSPEASYATASIVAPASDRPAGAPAPPAPPAPPLATPPGSTVPGAAREIVVETERETHVEREIRVIAGRVELADPSAPERGPEAGPVWPAAAPVPLVSPSALSTGAEASPSDRGPFEPVASPPPAAAAPVVVAEPVVAARPPSDEDTRVDGGAAPGAAVAEAPPPLLIEIGRIEIRVAPEAAAPAPQPRSRGTHRPVLALEDYLTGRGGSGR